MYGNIETMKINSKIFYILPEMCCLKRIDLSIITFTRWWLIKTTKHYFSRLRVTLLCYYHIHDNEKMNIPNRLKVNSFFL